MPSMQYVLHAHIYYPNNSVTTIEPFAFIVQGLQKEKAKGLLAHLMNAYREAEA
jgi:hypothetical protein